MQGGFHPTSSCLWWQLALLSPLSPVSSSVFIVHCLLLSSLPSPSSLWWAMGGHLIAVPCPHHCGPCPSLLHLALVDMSLSSLSSMWPMALFATCVVPVLVVLTLVSSACLCSCHSHSLYHGHGLFCCCNISKTYNE
jgi:hypothetical protein